MSADQSCLSRTGTGRADDIVKFLAALLFIRLNLRIRICVGRSRSPFISDSEFISINIVGLPAALLNLAHHALDRLRDLLLSTIDNLRARPFDQRRIICRRCLFVRFMGTDHYAVRPTAAAEIRQHSAQIRMPAAIDDHRITALRLHIRIKGFGNPHLVAADGKWKQIIPLHIDLIAAAGIQL